MNTIKRGLMTLIGVGMITGWPTAALAEPTALWTQLGCTGCHGENGFYKEKIKGAIGKPVDAVARWIQNAPSIKPDTMMPSFKGAISDSDSRALAAWVQERAAGMR
jgi:cytochrome c553